MATKVKHDRGSGRAGQRSVGSRGLQQVLPTSARGERGREPSTWHGIAYPFVVFECKLGEAWRTLAVSLWVWRQCCCDLVVAVWWVCHSPACMYWAVWIFSFLDQCWPPSCLLSVTSLIIHDAHAHNDIIGKWPSRSSFVTDYPLSGGILYLVMAVHFLM